MAASVGGMDTVHSPPHSPPPRTSSVRHMRNMSSITSPRPTRPPTRSEAANGSRHGEEEPKTAVKVAVRIRPPLQPSDPGFDLIPQRFRENTCEVPSLNDLSIQSPQGKKLFVFDRVFEQDTTQEGIWDYLSDSVTSFVKGYNVSILAYGQSGAGKSYTMGTSGAVDQSNPLGVGIIPRAAQALFDLLEGPSARPSGLQTPKRYSTNVLPTISSLSKMTTGMASKNWELRASYVEIYNEQLRDLLVNEAVPLSDRAQVAIREDTKGRILLTGLTQVNIDSVEDLLHALSVGSAIRQTDATAINARSSRSHAIFSLNLVQKKSNGWSSPPTSKADRRRSIPVEMSENNIVIDSKLHFVDLAGSERLKNTGATGERAKEGISINAGLASLGKVISQLSTRTGASHISYRDSRLTRILQDSLGGNAITFMVACVTPVAFHLNETLNTVHYAQRARAIQSKPVLQQSHEEGDKQALIERLRAEVAFLRDQIRHTDGDRRGQGDRVEKTKERETELQTQLLDLHENYNALSNRHAKLISELSRARETDSSDDVPLLREAIGESAIDRIKRSNSFAEAAEQMVLEYEKTIQTLEASLSKTRASLANSETTVMEKETRIAYMETIQQQLQARIAKAAHREQNAETYLHDLESRMEGASTEEERANAQIIELRKELTRLRESETSAEEYISTLEERLAEAEQDQDIMQQEIDRLEHVVERQRSIGRLDNVLGEFDLSQQTAQQEQPSETSPDALQVNGHKTRSRSSSVSASSAYSDVDGDERDSDDARSVDAKVPALNVAGDSHIPAQQVLLADKVENLTQELFDLRSEHESHLTDYEKLQQKYQTALETLARLEYGKENASSESPSHKVTTVLKESATKRDEKSETESERPASSRTIPADPSSQPSGVANHANDGRGTPVLHNDIVYADDVNERERLSASTPISPRGDRECREREMEMLELLQADHDVNIVDLADTYKSLAQRHEIAIRHVEKLKRDLQLAQSHRPASPSLIKPIHRRRSEDVLGFGSDRVQRCFTSLRNIANENLEANIDAQQSFELNLNLVMNELQSRSERLAIVENELAAVRKEMENKQTIISGLTRERSSLMTSSPVDFSVIGQMREQLQESEYKIRSLHEQHASKEKELQLQVSDLRSELAKQQQAAHRLPTPSEDRSLVASELSDDGSENGDEREQEVIRLQRELDAWQQKHEAAVASMQASEADLLATIAGLEESLRKSANADPSPEHSPRVGAELMDDEHPHHQRIEGRLKAEVAEYKAAAALHLRNFEELENSHAEVVKQIDQDTRDHEATRQELLTHKDLVSNLENQLKMHKTTVNIHQDSLETLQAAHSEEVASMQASLAVMEQENQKRQAAMEERHGEALKSLQDDLSQLQADLSAIKKSASNALGYDVETRNLGPQFQNLVEEGKELHNRHLKTGNELKAVQEELQATLTRTTEMETKMIELKTLNEEMMENLNVVTEREKKSSRLVEELEEQLNSTFDSQKASNHRMSTMQSDALQARLEMQREVEEQKLKIMQLEQQLATAQRQSVASNGSGLNRESLSPDTASAPLGRSGSQQSNGGSRKAPPGTLPMPPPLIPLPPLPGTPVAGSFSAAPMLPGGNERTSSPTDRAMSPTQNHSPPASRHTSKESPAISQLVEEQEARIRTIEKHLFAEKQLTATLEEALVDLETSANRTKTDMESWRKKCGSLEDELASLRRERHSSRASIQAVEEEREMRLRAEKARQALEQRMQELNAGNKKKKKNALNCF